ncbi:SDR family oxidoreductase [Bacillus massiliglaciei]|uniref:SDR family oxidoreductase n=1 Tax=Bacillus massiliglaciei TaxID=1816693 RepID=UPI000A9B030D|nr:SDR family oxidoreductase [Bacillus massiliglaciei]
MNVLVIGANGQIGKKLVELLKNSNEYKVRAMIRTKEQAEYFHDIGVETAVVSLTDTVEGISEAVKGSDAIVFTAGSGGNTGYDQTLLIDLDGAAKAIEAAELSGVKRFVMVSALQAHNRENWNDAIRPYYAAKHYADKILEQSSLDYTIIRPGGLVNEPGTGKIKASDNLERGSIPREDVAATIFHVLNKENTFKRSFDLVSGETEIEEAVKMV